MISENTVNNISTNGFYSLICEIDLSKSNTIDQLNQAEIKVIYNSNAYPSLIQQDITGDGTVYQYEFARFKVSNGNITDFVDRRTFVDYNSIYDIIESEAQEFLDSIQRTLQGLEDESNVLLKTGGTVNGEIEIASDGDISGNISANARKCKQIKNVKKYCINWCC